MSKKLIDILSPEDIAKSIAQNKKLLAIQAFKKGPRFIVDSKGRIKKMYKKGGEVTQFKGHFWCLIQEKQELLEEKNAAEDS